MLMVKARSVMAGAKLNPGYMVAFWCVSGNRLISDAFPDKHKGESLIETEEEAWVLARMFAEKTYGECVRIYVVDACFTPVPDYMQKMIENRDAVAPRSATACDATP